MIDRDLKPENTIQRALRYLATIDHHGTDAGDVGGAVFVKRSGRIASASGGGDYAAQMLLGRMKKAGLVEHSRWRITAAGRRAIISTS